MASEFQSKSGSLISPQRPSLSRQTTGHSLVQHAYDLRASTASLSKVIARGIGMGSTSLEPDKRVTSDEVLVSSEGTIASDEVMTEGITRQIFRTRSWVERTLAGITYDNLEDDSSDDESIVLQIKMTSRSDKPSMDVSKDGLWISERTLLSEHGVDSDDMHLSENNVENKLTDICLRALGWNMANAPISRTEKIKSRDADSASEILWSLASFM